jgi:transcriptional regulator with PAS, ATPase and Fis domain
MREFIVGLKFLLSDLREQWERKGITKPYSEKFNAVVQLDDYHKWEVKGEEPRTKEETQRKVAFRDNRKKYALFPEKQAPVEAPTVILIRGESGTGKSLFAKLIHHELRPDWPFREILSTGIPITLLEGELFGAIAGSYTDRKDTNPGRILLAYGGVLFLDEVGDMPPVLQGKLLKFFDDSCVYPLGWVGDGIHVPLIIVAATNADLEDLVRRKEFRPDLLYRLQQHEFTIAPLRERLWDLDRMVDFILQNPANAEYITHVRPEVLDRLKTYDFAGHFREIEGALFQAVQQARLKGTKTLKAEHLPARFGGTTTRAKRDG